MYFSKEGLNKKRKRPMAKKGSVMRNCGLMASVIPLG